MTPSVVQVVKNSHSVLGIVSLYTILCCINTLFIINYRSRKMYTPKEDGSQLQNILRNFNMCLRQEKGKKEKRKKLTDINKEDSQNDKKQSRRQSK